MFGEIKYPGTVLCLKESGWQNKGMKFCDFENFVPLTCFSFKVRYNGAYIMELIDKVRKAVPVAECKGGRLIR